MNNSNASKTRRVIYWLFLVVVLAILVAVIWLRYFRTYKKTEDNPADQNQENVADEYYSDDQDQDPNIPDAEDEPTTNNIQDQNLDSSDEDTTITNPDTSLPQNSDANTNYENIEGGNFDDRSQ